MADPDFSKQLTLHTDVSRDGLRAVLYQDGVMTAIAYASRSLSPTEKKYYLRTGKLESLALKWPVTDQFRDYLYYSPKFTVVTDNNPLTYILKLLVSNQRVFILFITFYRYDKWFKLCPKMAAESPLRGQNQEGRPIAKIQIELN